MCRSLSVGWLCFLVVVAVAIQVRGQTPGTQSGQPLPTTGTAESRIGPLAFEGGYASREKEAKLWGPDNQWKLIILCAANQETKYHTALDERSAYFYEAVTLSDGMTTKTPGVGQAYMGIRKDKDGQWLQGDKNYTLRVPPNAPAKQFWALTLYDTETRSFIDTPHDIAGLDSRKDLVKNADGSVDLYIGPEAPKGNEKNWIPTAPGRGWFGLFRLYAPTEAYFDRSWKLPDLARGK